MFVYCFFCQTNKCNQIVSLLKNNAIIHKAIYPQVVQRQRKKGENYERIFDLLPGYIFVYTNENIVDSLVEITRINGVIRCIGNSENDFILTGGDYTFAINLYKKNGIINNISLQNKNNKLKIIDPMFSQMNAEVSKVDYKKGRARIEYDFVGRKCYTWVSIEMLD